MGTRGYEAVQRDLDRGHRRSIIVRPAHDPVPSNSSWLTRARHIAPLARNNSSKDLKVSPSISWHLADIWLEELNKVVSEETEVRTTCLSHAPRCARSG